METNLLFLLSLIPFCAGKQVSYDEYGLYRLTPRTSASLNQLKQMEQGVEKQFWTEVKSENVPVDVLVPPYDTIKMETLIRRFEVDAVLLNSNIQQVLDEERNGTNYSGGFGWTDYHNLDEIYNWLVSLGKLYPDNVKLIEIGYTFENRKILGAHVSFNPLNSRKGIFIESNMNAREWITSATSTFILNELLTSPDPEINAVAKKYDWYIVPIFNPDGFEYTKKFNRLWRKSRVQHTLMCYGTDLQKNWGLWHDGKPNENACSDIYKGPRSFSDPAVQSISRFIKGIKHNLVGYVALESHSAIVHGEHNELMSKFSINEEDLSFQFGSKNKIGNIVTAISTHNSGSVEWVKRVYQIPLAFSYVIRETGKYGCIIPANQIIPTGKQVLRSLVTILRKY